MNRILIFITFYSLSIPAISQESEENESTHYCLYEEKSLTIAVASPYSFELNAPGVNIRMYYNIGETICFGPEYAYFRNGEYEVVDFDFVGHYIIGIPWVGHLSFGRSQLYY